MPDSDGKATPAECKLALESFSKGYNAALDDLLAQFRANRPDYAPATFDIIFHAKGLRERRKQLDAEALAGLS